MSYSQSNVQYNQILIWLCVLSFFSVLNEMVLNVSLPDIASSFNKTPASTNWVNTAFMLTSSIGTAVYGKLSDRIGIKKLVLFGLIVQCTEIGRASCRERVSLHVYERCVTSRRRD